MANDKEPQAMSKENLIASQAEYKGNSHFDLEDVEFLKDSDYYKKGDKDKIHPATASLFRAKGLIK